MIVWKVESEHKDTLEVEPMGGGGMRVVVSTRASGGARIITTTCLDRGRTRSLVDFIEQHILHTIEDETT